MRYKLLLIVIVFVIVEACQKNLISSTEPQEVIIAGQVINKHNYDPNTVSILINEIATGEQLREVCDLDEEGKFVARFKRYYPQEVMLKYFSIWNIFIHPGDSIYVELDAEKMGSKKDVYHALTFSGDAVKENEQLSKFNAWFIPLRMEESDSRIEESRFPPEKYTRYRDSLRTQYHQLANEFIKNNKISEPIISWIYSEIEHNYFHELVYYPFAHRSLNNYPKEWQVPVSYFNFFENANINSNFIINSNFTKSFVNEYYNFYIIKNLEQEFTELGLVKDTILTNGSVAKLWTVNNRDSVLIHRIIQNTPKEIRQFVLNRFFDAKLRYETDTETFEKYSKLINKEISETFLLTNLYKNYEELKQIKNATNEYKFNTIDAHNNAGTDLLKQIISVNEGKVVYIDCWAIWCGPCLTEMPNSRKLMYELKDEDVTFVFLCCNSPEKSARNQVEQLNLGGTHYFLDPDQTNYIQKELSFSGYPNYVLIDKKGKIVESSPVLRPGNEKTRTKILELVNE